MKTKSTFKVSGGIPPVIRIISLVIACVFTITSTTYGVPRNLWDLRTTGKSATAQKTGPLTYVDPAMFVVPENFGSVTERFKSAGTKNSKKLIIQIQDSHCNYEAQKNIWSMIDIFSKDKNIAGCMNMIAIEGAEGIVDATPIRKYPDPEIRRQGTDYLMRTGWLTGAECYEINAKDNPIPLFGVEQRALYNENLDFFKDVKEASKKSKTFFKKLSNAIEVLKLKVFSGALAQIIKKRDQWDENVIKFTDFCKYLASEAVKVGIGKKGAKQFSDKRDYPNLTAVIESIELEKRIDSKKINIQRKAMIAALQKKMVKEELSELVKQSLFLRIGRITSGMFYNYLKQIAVAKKIDMAKYPDLKGYIELVELHTTVNAGKLFDEVDNLDRAIKQKLYKNKDEKELDLVIDQVKMLQNLLDLRMTRRDLTYYENNKKDITSGKLIQKVARLSDRHNLRDALTGSLGWLEKNKKLNVAASQGFYNAALKRDDMLVENTLREMEKRKSKVVAMITGGFHTQGMKEQFKAKGYSYVVVTPRLTQACDDKIYLSRMMNKLSEFDKLFTQTGKRLAPWVALQAELGLVEKEFKTLASTLELLNDQEVKVGATNIIKVAGGIMKLEKTADGVSYEKISNKKVTATGTITVATTADGNVSFTPVVTSEEKEVAMKSDETKAEEKPTEDEGETQETKKQEIKTQKTKKQESEKQKTKKTRKPIKIVRNTLKGRISALEKEYKSALYSNILITPSKGELEDQIKGHDEALAEIAELLKILAKEIGEFLPSLENREKQIRSVELQTKENREKQIRLVKLQTKINFTKKIDKRKLKETQTAERIADLESSFKLPVPSEPVISTRENIEKYIEDINNKIAEIDELMKLYKDGKGIGAGRIAPDKLENKRQTLVAQKDTALQAKTYLRKEKVKIAFRVEAKRQRWGGFLTPKTMDVLAGDYIKRKMVDLDIKDLKEMLEDMEYVANGGEMTNEEKINALSAKIAAAKQRIALLQVPSISVVSEELESIKKAEEPAKTVAVAVSSDEYSEFDLGLMAELGIKKDNLTPEIIAEADKLLKVDKRLSGKNLDAMEIYKNDPMIRGALLQLLAHMNRESGKYNDNKVLYHNLRHFKGVLQTYMRIAKAKGNEGIFVNGERSLKVGLVSALFHDTGYYDKERVDERTGISGRVVLHEQASRNYAKEFMTKLSKISGVEEFKPAEIEAVLTMIDRTKMVMNNPYANATAMTDLVEQDDKAYEEAEAIYDRLKAKSDREEGLSNETDINDFNKAKADMDAIMGGRLLAYADVYGDADDYLETISGLQKEFKEGLDPAWKPTMLEQVAATVTGEGEKGAPGFQNEIVEVWRFGPLKESKYAGKFRLPSDLKEDRDNNIKRNREFRRAFNVFRGISTGNRDVARTIIENYVNTIEKNNTYAGNTNMVVEQLKKEINSFDQENNERVAWRTKLADVGVDVNSTRYQRLKDKRHGMFEPSVKEAAMEMAAQTVSSDGNVIYVDFRNEAPGGIEELIKEISQEDIIDLIVNAEISDIEELLKGGKFKEALKVTQAVTKWLADKGEFEKCQKFLYAIMEKNIYEDSAKSFKDAVVLDRIAVLVIINSKKNLLKIEYLEAFVNRLILQAGTADIEYLYELVSNNINKEDKDILQNAMGKRIKQLGDTAIEGNKEDLALLVNPKGLGKNKEISDLAEKELEMVNSIEEILTGVTSIAKQQAIKKVAKDERAIPNLIKALNTEDDDVWRAAVDASISMGEPAIGELIKALESKNHMVRLGAAQILQDIGDKDALAELEEIIKQEINKNVKSSMEFAIRDLKKKLLVAEVIPAKKEKAPQAMALRAELALADLKGSSGLDELIDKVEALAKGADESEALEAVSILSEYAREGDYRNYAARVLAMIVLNKRSNTASEKVKSDAYNALKEAVANGNEKAKKFILSLKIMELTDIALDESKTLEDRKNAIKNIGLSENGISAINELFLIASSDAAGDLIKREAVKILIELSDSSNVGVSQYAEDRFSKIAEAEQKEAQAEVPGTGEAIKEAAKMDEMVKLLKSKEGIESILDEDVIAVLKYDKQSDDLSPEQQDKLARYKELKGPIKKGNDRVKDEFINGNKKDDGTKETVVLDVSKETHDSYYRGEVDKFIEGAEGAFLPVNLNDELSLTKDEDGAKHKAKLGSEKVGGVKGMEKLRKEQIEVMEANVSGYKAVLGNDRYNRLLNRLKEMNSAELKNMKINTLVQPWFELMAQADRIQGEEYTYTAQARKDFLFGLQADSVAAILGVLDAKTLENLKVLLAKNDSNGARALLVDILRKVNASWRINNPWTDNPSLLLDPFDVAEAGGIGVGEIMKDVVVLNAILRTLNKNDVNLPAGVKEGIDAAFSAGLDEVLTNMEDTSLLAAAISPEKAAQEAKKLALANAEKERSAKEVREKLAGTRTTPLLDVYEMTETIKQAVKDENAADLLDILVNRRGELHGEQERLVKIALIGLCVNNETIYTKIQTAKAVAFSEKNRDLTKALNNIMTESLKIQKEKLFTGKQTAGEIREKIAAKQSAALTNSMKMKETIKQAVKDEKADALLDILVNRRGELQGEQEGAVKDALIGLCAADEKASRLVSSEKRKAQRASKKSLVALLDEIIDTSEDPMYGMTQINKEDQESLAKRKASTAKILSFAKKTADKKVIAQKGSSFTSLKSLLLGSDDPRQKLQAFNELKRRSQSNESVDNAPKAISVLQDAVLGAANINKNKLITRELRSDIIDVLFSVATNSEVRKNIEDDIRTKAHNAIKEIMNKTRSAADKAEKKIFNRTDADLDVIAINSKAKIAFSKMDSVRDELDLAAKKKLGAGKSFKDIARDLDRRDEIAPGSKVKRASIKAQVIKLVRNSIEKNIEGDKLTFTIKIDGKEVALSIKSGEISETDFAQPIVKRNAEGNITHVDITISDKDKAKLMSDLESKKPEEFKSALDILADLVSHEIVEDNIKVFLVSNYSGENDEWHNGVAHALMARIEGGINDLNIYMMDEFMDFSDLEKIVYEHEVDPTHEVFFRSSLTRINKFENENAAKEFVRNKGKYIKDIYANKDIDSKKKMELLKNVEKITNYAKLLILSKTLSKVASSSENIRIINGVFQGELKRAIKKGELSRVNQLVVGMGRNFTTEGTQKTVFSIIDMIIDNPKRIDQLVYDEFHGLKIAKAKAKAKAEKPLIELLEDFDIDYNKLSVSDKESVKKVSIILANALDNKIPQNLNTDLFIGVNKNVAKALMNIIKKKSMDQGVDFVIGHSDGYEFKNNKVAGLVKMWVLGLKTQNLKNVTIVKADVKNVPNRVADVWVEKGWAKKVNNKYVITKNMGLMIGTQSAIGFSEIIDNESLGQLSSFLVSNADGELKRENIELIAEIGLPEIAEMLKTGDLEILDVLDVGVGTLDDIEKSANTLIHA
ncbi:MAG: HEAT repeat domain-containing protein [Candidatus Ancaeobacter aquaticus]|nr:HEAT repeat domain-containing protein [Candidatus Ancaeobacter aquaticus]